MKRVTVILIGVAVACLICIHIFIAAQSQGTLRKPVYVVFRMDDYSARSSTELETRIIDIFKREGASLTFGVIPFVCSGENDVPSPQETLPLPPEKGDLLRRAVRDGVLDVALHGYSHQTISRTLATEFKWMPYDAQLERVGKGKQFLEGVVGAPVTTFIPPFNEYDFNTLRALGKTGFSMISARMDGDGLETSPLQFLPATCDLDHVRAAVHAARAASDKQPLIVVLFHHTDFREIDSHEGTTTLSEFSGLVHWLKSQKDVRLISIREARQTITDLSAARYAKTHWRPLEVLLPRALQDKNPALFYREAGIFPHVFVSLTLFYGCIALLSLAVSYGIGCRILPRFGWGRKAAVLAGMLVGTCAVIYVSQHEMAIPPRFMAGDLDISEIIGLCIGGLHHRRFLHGTRVKA